MPGEPSMPSTWAPRAAISAVSTPVPQPRSSTRSPGWGSSRSSSGRAHARRRSRSCCRRRERSTACELGVSYRKTISSHSETPGLLVETTVRTLEALADFVTIIYEHPLHAISALPDLSRPVRAAGRPSPASCCGMVSDHRGAGDGGEPLGRLSVERAAHLHGLHPGRAGVRPEEEVLALVGEEELLPQPGRGRVRGVLVDRLDVVGGRAPRRPGSSPSTRRRGPPRAALR